MGKGGGKKKKKNFFALMFLLRWHEPHLLSRFDDHTRKVNTELLIDFITKCWNKIKNIWTNSSEKYFKNQVPHITSTYSFKWHVAISFWENINKIYLNRTLSAILDIIIFKSTKKSIIVLPLCFLGNSRKVLCLTFVQ